MGRLCPFLATKPPSPTPTRGSGRQGHGYALGGDPHPAKTNQNLVARRAHGEVRPGDRARPSRPLLGQSDADIIWGDGNTTKDEGSTGNPPRGGGEYAACGAAATARPVRPRQSAAAGKVRRTCGLSCAAATCSCSSANGRGPQGCSMSRSADDWNSFQRHWESWALYTQTDFSQWTTYRHPSVLPTT